MAQREETRGQNLQNVNCDLLMVHMANGIMSALSNESVKFTELRLARRDHTKPFHFPTNVAFITKEELDDITMFRACNDKTDHLELVKKIAQSPPMPDYTDAHFLSGTIEGGEQVPAPALCDCCASDNKIVASISTFDKCPHRWVEKYEGCCITTGYNFENRVFTNAAKIPEIHPGPNTTLCEYSDPEESGQESIVTGDESSSKSEDPIVESSDQESSMEVDDASTSSESSTNLSSVDRSQVCTRRVTRSLANVQINAKHCDGSASDDEPGSEELEDESSISSVQDDDDDWTLPSRQDNSKSVLDESIGMQDNAPFAGDASVEQQSQQDANLGMEQATVADNISEDSHASSISSVSRIVPVERSESKKRGQRKRIRSVQKRAVKNSRRSAIERACADIRFKKSSKATKDTTSVEVKPVVAVDSVEEAVNSIEDTLEDSFEQDAVNEPELQIPRFEYQVDLQALRSLLEDDSKGLNKRQFCEINEFTSVLSANSVLKHRKV